MTQIILWGGRRPPREPFPADAIVVDYLARAISRGPVRVWLQDAIFTLTAACLARSPALAEWRDIEEALYGDREDGGPDDIRATLQVILSRHRHQLRALGIVLETRHGYGLRAAIVDPELLREAA